MPLRLTLAVAFALLLSACAHYQLGTDGKLAFSTLYIEPVENKALLPQAAALVGTQLRESFLRDGVGQRCGEERQRVVFGLKLSAVGIGFLHCVDGAIFK